jgi:DNA polymerase-3 subunit epsilon/CBS domain-containing protein
MAPEDMAPGNDPAMTSPAPSTPLVALDAIAIDTETTGLDVRVARLVQFGAIRIRGEVVQKSERMSALVNPGVAIPAQASRVHGIFAEHLAGADDFATLAPVMETFLGSAILIGHTIGYDIAILRREYELAGRTWTEPRTIDIRILARLTSAAGPHDDLESICGALGIEITGRHSAIGDAVAAAEAFVALIPQLRARGIRTLAELEAAARARAEQDARTHGGLMAPEVPPAADPARTLVKVDSFPYRHRVRDVMSTPPVIAPGTTSLQDAMTLLLQKRVSSAIVSSPERGLGIITERDVLRAVATGGPAALSGPIDEIATRPLHTIEQDAFVYRAIGRMDRLSIRHLVVVDRQGAVVGALTTRNLLRHRATTAMVLGDQIDSAHDVPALAQAWAQLPRMARMLLDEGVDARLVSSVISSEICAVARWAALMAERRLADAGRGGPPNAYALMVLGSAGRGESLLAADQDHAIVYAEGAPDGPEDQWFAALGEEVSNILDAVGIPFCKGGVMSKNAGWRMSRARWLETINRWVQRQRPEDLLNVDIFFDAVPVHGALRLAEDLFDQAYEAGRRTPSFIKLLSENARGARVPLTLFRKLRTDSNGRIDLKMHGLFPLVAGARVLAIKHGIRARATPERLEALIASGHIGESQGADLIDGHRTILTAMLTQQLTDGERGIPLSSRVAPDRLDDRTRAALTRAVTTVATMTDLVSEGRF